MNFTLPGQLAVGLTRRVSPATLVGLGAAWQDWSRFGRATVSVMDRRVDLFPGGLRDTWNLSAGFRHELGPRWSVSAGLAYDSSPAKSAAMPAYFPVADQWRVSGGVEHRWGERLVTRLALSVIDQGDVHVAQPLAEWPLPASSAFTGSLRRNRAYVLAVASDFAD
jgi:long-chain fatty acid transport protein